MTFMQVRNAVVSGLEKHIGCPVILSEQINDRPKYPYCYYSVLTARTSDHALGLNKVLEDGVGFKLSRTEPVAATMSFTFCSMNRCTADGFIFGEDEALELAEKAQGFFLLNSHCLSTEYGDIVVRNLSGTAPRSGFLTEETVRRYGFDVKLGYVRTDEMPTEAIGRVNFNGKPY